MNKLPKKLQKLFWDVNFLDLDEDLDKNCIISRLLDKGDIEELQWLFRTYSEDKVIKVLKSSRNISNRSAIFWAQLLDVDQKEVKCLQISFRIRQMNF